MKAPEEKLVALLKERGLHIAFAESCTGGLCVSRLVSVPDASAVLDASFVTYANAAKVKYLGVSEASIAAYGVVSECVAAEMAEGAARASGAQVGVATSGIAGPGGGTAEKPVGTVCFGFFVKGESKSFTRRFDGDRTAVRSAASDFVYETLLSLL